MKTTGIIVAAGVGERLAAGGPKAYVAIAGEPMLVHAARAFLAARSIDDLVMVVPPSARGQTNEVLDRAGLTSVTLCAGGATRQLSVAAGLDHCALTDGLVAVHDAARPLITPDLVDRVVGALIEPWSAVAPALPVVDTLKLVDHVAEAVVRTVDRAALWAVQTPQVFSWSELAQVHARLAVPGGAQVTDDLALVERAGGKVRIVRGDRRNFKVTYPEDLAMAEALLRPGVQGP